MYRQANTEEYKPRPVLFAIRHMLLPTNNELNYYNPVLHTQGDNPFYGLVMSYINFMIAMNFIVNTIKK